MNVPNSGVRRIRKAVFPVAGLGTRFLPATKASPKEMLPVVDKPLVQYAVEEAVAAGVEVMVFVNGRNKRAIPDHFDKAYELERELEARGKQKLLDIVRGIVPENVTCVYIRQPAALGLGHAVLCAQPVIGNDPFAVLLADDLLDGRDKPVLAQMCDTYAEYGASILAVEQVPTSHTDQYGIVQLGKKPGKVAEIEGMVEKPKPEVAPSNLAVVGRYVLTPRIFELIRELPRGAGGEYQLTDAIAGLLPYEKVFAYQFDGKRYDCGSKLGYLQANVEYALRHPDVADDFRAYLQQAVEEGLLETPA
ncbi:UTP--glucose-1-phosphate uridylyltransferase GalU [Candidatus Macondimonas diazotrophica]|jgi:UTP--glucose-1-phosphate uridylyltransferase|uniref:UTP--glucose-1-phosphate uridylyltransferase n=1 Tax=Candidatus Macondimonas diazotrophica TaxID=2305248 RepID=A0A4Z0FDS5_9GAMM|nr:UTP--glucose-1-phosphate uridylyltransferase GalU [Candidatus Macondimonas diazotrophica]NCU00084.1 UTP--glucose-1-phosphate uridylyltransferase GalU [Candidatus Macondimonas diazotrophica]TFZ83869.1 UTP--glucose-1-phosphate uridylyltransferase GalU [Candidatus Macondimonas diazotrophica]HBG31672.1 UTP--glucose-1-phosphate uridylyltransferase [Gammaproteobacteria bacterium]HBG51998.1 UTP--glucose-1-phosphate uridylyltransferase [Gammaproteobacteria bacterium]